MERPGGRTLREVRGPVRPCRAPRTLPGRPRRGRRPRLLDRTLPRGAPRGARGGGTLDGVDRDRGPAELARGPDPQQRRRTPPQRAPPARAQRHPHRVRRTPARGVPQGRGRPHAGDAAHRSGGDPPPGRQRRPHPRLPARQILQPGGRKPLPGGADRGLRGEPHPRARRLQRGPGPCRTVVAHPRERRSGGARRPDPHRGDTSLRAQRAGVDVARRRPRGTGLRLPEPRPDPRRTLAHPQPAARPPRAAPDRRTPGGNVHRECPSHDSTAPGTTASAWAAIGSQAGTRAQSARKVP